MCASYVINDNTTHSCTEFKFVTMLRANKPSQAVREPSQTLHRAEETFLQSTVNINKLTVLLVHISWVTALSFG